jgi:hypothetical protein
MSRTPYGFAAIADTLNVIFIVAITTFSLTIVASLSSTMHVLATAE